MGNYVIAVGNYLIVSPQSWGITRSPTPTPAEARENMQQNIQQNIQRLQREGALPEPAPRPRLPPGHRHPRPTA
jgi:hypothetical protein